MSNATPKPTKAAGWGSFLSSAVSGLESRLDNILADENGPAGGGAPRTAAQRREVIARAGGSGGTATVTAAQNKPIAATAAGGAAADEASAAATPAAAGDSRASSRSRANDRLQERLARAMNKGAVDGGRAGSRGPGSPVVGTDKATPGQSPLLKPERGEDTPRTSTDSRAVEGIGEDKSEDLTGSSVEDDATEGKKADEEAFGPKKAAAEKQDDPGISEVSTAQDASFAKPTIDHSTRLSADSAPTEPQQTTINTSPSTQAVADAQSTTLSLSEEDKQRQEEMHAHLERIDALQAKLHYLARQATDAAARASSEAEAGSTEQKLADKDGQIAALMDEGLRMSKTELRLQGVIKEMRRQKTERDQADAETRRRLDKAERERADALDGRAKAEARVREGEAKVAVIGRIERDVDGLKREKEQAQELIRDLRRQLSDAVTRAEDAERKAQSNKLEQERRRAADLKDELENFKIEKRLAEERRRTEAREAKEEAARKEERAKMLEAELRNELANAETKLELLRSRTEEASSFAGGDSQTKLLRQVETLQTQYALASDNWQGIEATLNARVVTLEKERDELAKRESDVRKRAREIGTKGRRLEDDLAAARTASAAAEQDAVELRTQAEKLQKRLDGADAALEAARADFEREKKVWETDLQNKLDEEKTKLRLDLQSPHNASSDGLYLRTESPTVSSFHRKHSAQDLGGLTGILQHPPARRMPSIRTLSGEGTTPGERQPSRRASAFSAASPPISRGMSASYINGIVSSPHPPSIDVIADEDMVSEAPVTGTSSPRHRGSNAGVGTPVADVMSASTVNAGPSVQLVERMSAAVRRLESEKASLKEELSRLQEQRDEARGEVVKLMRDVESGKEVQSRLGTVEEELNGIKDKWERTLEVLGEREEQCEELKHDVLDLKGIIREMAEERAQK